MNNRVPLPAGSTLGKSFEYGLDINLGLFGTPAWQSVRRMSAWAPTYPKTTSDVASYDDLGAPNEEVDGRGFATAFTVQGNRSTTTGLYLPEVEALLAAAKSKGEAAVVDVRWYHKPEVGTANPNDAGRAFATVEASRQNTGNTGSEVYSIALAGKGEFTPIANPFTGWDATAPIIAGITPAGAGTGNMIVINGAGFLGATAVKFAAANATDFEVISAGSIAAIVPSGSAGAVAITVVTPGGTSAAFSYTRAA